MGRLRTALPKIVPIALALAVVACDPSEIRTVEEREPLRVAEALAGDVAGFLRATEPRPFHFPADHGAHDGFRTEWWYFTGNLEDDRGSHYGFQLTFFRQALAPNPAPRRSAWAADHIVFAHLALSDERRARFEASERFSREALGLAGVRGSPLRVWVEDWEASSLSPDDAFPMRLRAQEGGLGLDLTVAPRKPPVLHGEQGLSRKGPQPGSASYYYSFTRLGAEGTVTVDGRPARVRGLAWLDREWSTSVLDEGQVGWDWFAIQLEDGRDVMLFQLRRADGSRDAFDAGALVDADGRATILDANDFVLVPRGFHESRRGTRYPVRWSIEIPAQGMTLDVEPMLPDQELDVSLRYWEGAVTVSGRDGDGPVLGRGFLEMTGYDAEASVGRARAGSPTGADVR
jgi:predicted secreted hydrolase